MNTVEQNAPVTETATVKKIRGRKPQLQMLDKYLAKNGARLQAADLDRAIKALTELRKNIVVETSAPVAAPVTA